MFKIIFGGILGISVCTVAAFEFFEWLHSSKEEKEKNDNIIPKYKPKTLVDLIGNTPIICLPTLSKYTGCTILVKLEYLNPGGSSKDRAALRILQDAVEKGLLVEGGTVFEGTSGSTGISLAMLCNQKGYKCHLLMPNDVSLQKSQFLHQLGATVELVPPASIIDPNMFVNLARKRANDLGSPQGFYADQFENESNFLAHYEGTGPEIWNELGIQLDFIILSAGTSGTIAGISKYLKEKNGKIKVILADPQGSGLFHKVKHNIMYSHTEKEGKRKRHQIDTIVEGVGINRITNLFRKAEIDDAITINDQQVVDMARYLLRFEGLFVGSSSALNVVAALKIAKESGPGHTILTLLSDQGHRHTSKLWNEEFLNSKNLKVKENICLEDFC